MKTVIFPGLKFCESYCYITKFNSSLKFMLYSIKYNHNETGHSQQDSVVIYIRLSAFFCVSTCGNNPQKTLLSTHLKFSEKGINGRFTKIDQRLVIETHGLIYLLLHLSFSKRRCISTYKCLLFRKVSIYQFVSTNSHQSQLNVSVSQMVFLQMKYTANLIFLTQWM